MKRQISYFHHKIPWRTLQIGVNIATIVTGFCTFLPLSYVTKYLHGQCMLHAKINILSINSTHLLLDKPNTVWGTNRDCWYITYTPVTASIHAFIWCWFFLLMKVQLKKEHRQFPMLVFSSILHSIVFVDTFVSSSITSAGFNGWCYSLKRALRQHNARMGCKETQDLMWTNAYIDDQKHAIYDFLRAAQVSSWLQSLTVLAQSVLCGYKLYCWVVYTTGGLLDIRRCVRSTSLETPSFESPNLLHSTEDSLNSDDNIFHRSGKHNQSPGSDFSQNNGGARIQRHDGNLRHSDDDILLVRHDNQSNLPEHNNLFHSSDDLLQNDHENPVHVHSNNPLHMDTQDGQLFHSSDDLLRSDAKKQLRGSNNKDNRSVSQSNLLQSDEDILQGHRNFINIQDDNASNVLYMSASENIGNIAEVDVHDYTDETRLIDNDKLNVSI